VYSYGSPGGSDELFIFVFQLFIFVFQLFILVFQLFISVFQLFTFFQLLIFVFQLFIFVFQLFIFVFVFLSKFLLKIIFAICTKCLLIVFEINFLVRIDPAALRGKQYGGFTRGSGCF
jgi:hypothetical protein